MALSSALRRQQCDAPAVTIEFTRGEIQDSWLGIDRAEVRRKIGLFANEYERSRRPRTQPQATRH